MPQTRIHFSTKMEAVADSIRRRILDGRLAPGLQLMQEQVAHELGVSPTPVREAFGVLEAEGLIERRPHRGVVVAERDPQDVAEAFEFRSAVEVLAIKWIGERMTGALLHALSDNVRHARTAMRDRRIEEFRLTGLQFHRLLMSGARSSTLDEVMTVLMNRSLLNPPLDRSGMARVLADHEELVRALKSGDARKAERLMATHMKWIRAVGSPHANGGLAVGL